MKFKAYQLIIDGVVPILDDLWAFVNDPIEHLDYNDYHYISTKNVVGNRYIWVQTFFNNGALYSEKVYNKLAKSSQANPRQKHQIEPNNQMFFCYDCQRRCLYLSDPTKKAFVKQYIGNSVARPVFIKPIIASMDDFIKHLHTLQSITFTQERNLYTQVRGGLFDKQVNALGLDLPQSMKVRLEYAALPIGNARIVLERLEKANQDAQFENIVAIGMNDDGIEQAFDFQSILTTIEADGEKDSDGHYDSKEICGKLIHQIEKAGTKDV